jgi:DUF4097 and DUF4098 domain-containing protein YvlB
VHGGSASAARIVVTSRRGDLDDRLELNFENVPGGITVKGRRRHRFEFFGRNDRIEFDIELPSSTSLDIRTSGGSISVDSIEAGAKLRTSGGSIGIKRLGGALEAETSGGSIDLADVRGDSRVETSGGGITAENLGGSFQADTSGGSIEIQRVHGDVRAHTSGGTVNVGDVGGVLEASTSGGSIHASIPPGNARGGRLRTGGGGIRVMLDPKVALTIDASGEGVHTDLPLNVRGEISRHHLHGDLNGGGASLRLSASGGSVRIESR